MAASRLPVDIPLRQSDVLRLGTVHIDEKMRIIERLLDVQVGRARYVDDLPEQPVDEFAVALQVLADYLDIDRSRQVQN